jgi:hypothetical protein
MDKTRLHSGRRDAGRRRSSALWLGLVGGLGIGCEPDPHAGSPRPEWAGALDDAGRPGAPAGGPGGAPPLAPDTSRYDASISCAAPNKCSPGAGRGATWPFVDGGAANPSTFTGTLVIPLGPDASVVVEDPHHVQLLAAETGKPLSPPLTTVSTAWTGLFTFTSVPFSPFLILHVSGKGAGDAATSTYDSLTFFAPHSGDRLVRVATVGTGAVYPAAGGVEQLPDRAPLEGVVYRVSAGGKRIGVVGCAQVFLDQERHPALQADQRYVAADGLPTTLEKLSRTLSSNGKFYFGNLTKGRHTLRVSLDGGKTILPERTFYLPLTRAEATSEHKDLLIDIGLDIPDSAPAPADCPAS